MKKYELSANEYVGNFETETYRTREDAETEIEDYVEDLHELFYVETAEHDPDHEMTEEEQKERIRKQFSIEELPLTYADLTEDETDEFAEEVYSTLGEDPEEVDPTYSWACLCWDSNGDDPLLGDTLEESARLYAESIREEFERLVAEDREREAEEENEEEEEDEVQDPT